MTTVAELEKKVDPMTDVHVTIIQLLRKEVDALGKGMHEACKSINHYKSEVSRVVESVEQVRKTTVQEIRVSWVILFSAIAALAGVLLVVTLQTHSAINQRDATNLTAFGDKLDQCKTLINDSLAGVYQPRPESHWSMDLIFCLVVACATGGTVNLLRDILRAIWPTKKKSE